MYGLNNKKVNEKYKLRVLWFVAVCFVLSLIPIYAVGGYAHPSVDDYYYTDNTSMVWQQTHSVGAVLEQSFREMQITYNEWQGNFSAIFLMRLQPGLFGEACYFVTPLILITAFVLCSFFFFYMVVRGVFGGGRKLAAFIAVCITFVSMQMTKVPSDSFYWFNGAIYYTFFYSLMLLVYGLMISIRCRMGVVNMWGCSGLGTADDVTTSMVTHGKKHMLSCVILELISLALLFFIGGSNFPTALLTVVILALIVVWDLIKIKYKKTFAERFVVVCHILNFLALMFGFIVSIKAPGNAIRQSSVGGSTSLVKTFAFTFAYGGYSLANSLNAPVIVFFIVCIPVFYLLALRGRQHFGYSYRWPLFVLVFTYGIYCSMGTPVFYAQGLRMPYRIVNIIYFASYIFFAFNLTYFLGWIGVKYGETPLVEKLRGWCGKIAADSGKLALAIGISLFVFLVACIGLIDVSETGEKTGKASFTGMPLSVSAAYSIVSGDAAQYDRELTERAEYLESLVGTDEDNIALPALTVTPEPIFHTDITSDAAHWKNAHLAKYYHKQAIWIEE